VGRSRSCWRRGRNIHLYTRWKAYRSSRCTSHRTLQSPKKKNWCWSLNFSVVKILNLPCQGHNGSRVHRTLTRDTFLTSPTFVAALQILYEFPMRLYRCSMYELRAPCRSRFKAVCFPSLIAHTFLVYTASLSVPLKLARCQQRRQSNHWGRIMPRL